MPQILHYFVLIFIVFICAEIRNVLFHDMPYQNEPVGIWNETVQGTGPAGIPAVKPL